jgi:hypothetical protein
MKPISNVNFGNTSGAIKMTYNDGTSVVDGFVVKQIGSARFVCAPVANAAAQTTVLLAQTTAVASALTEGYGTIKGSTFGSNAVQYVSTIHSATCVTTEGLSFVWNRGPAAQDGNLGLSSI